MSIYKFDARCTVLLGCLGCAIMIINNAIVMIICTTEISKTDDKLLQQQNCAFSQNNKRV